MKKTSLHIVVIDGQALDDTNDIAGMLEAFAHIQTPKILVHGTGEEAAFVSEKLVVLAQMINGNNMANSESLKLSKMIYNGMLNNSLVGQLQARNMNAIGMSGADLNTIQSSEIISENMGDYHMGKIEKINTQAIHQLLQAAIVPVFCTITHNKKGLLLLNTAQDIASHMAAAMNELYEVQILTHGDLMKSYK